MTRIAILTCSNVVQELNCPSFSCFHALHERWGLFAGYTDPAREPKIYGIISCAGCPTISAPEKIFRRIRPLIAAGIEVLHLSTCLTVLCPFKNKYMAILKEKYPQLAVVEGTHGVPEGLSSESFREGLKASVKGMLIQPRKSMADMIAIQRHQSGE